MTGWLAWQNLVFCLPLALSLLLLAGSALGLHHHHHESDLGPLTIVLLIASLSFGALGLLANSFLAPLYSIAVAFSGMVAITWPAARLLQRHLPSSETYLISRRDFAGCTGTLLLPADAESGYAQIKDAEGNVHNLQCRAVSGRLAKGTAILVIEYDEDRRTFLIDELGGTS